MGRERDKPYHHGNLAPHLTFIAARMLEQDGLAALSLREVARRAGVSAPAVYRHFASKDALLAAVAAQGFVTLVKAFETARRGQPTPLQAVRAVGLAYMDFAAAQPHLHALMFGARPPEARGNSELAHWAARATQLLLDTAAACFGPQADARQSLTAAVALWSLVHGFSALRRDGQLNALPDPLQPSPSEVLAALLPGVG